MSLHVCHFLFTSLGICCWLLLEEWYLVAWIFDLITVVSLRYVNKKLTLIQRLDSMITFDNYKQKEHGHIFKFWGKIYRHLKCDLNFLHYLREHFVRIRA